MFSKPWSKWNVAIEEVLMQSTSSCCSPTSSQRRCEGVSCMQVVLSKPQPLLHGRQNSVPFRLWEKHCQGLLSRKSWVQIPEKAFHVGPLSIRSHLPRCLIYESYIEMWKCRYLLSVSENGKSCTRVSLLHWDVWWCHQQKLNHICWIQIMINFILTCLIFCQLWSGKLIF